LLFSWPDIALVTAFCKARPGLNEVESGICEALSHILICGIPID
jgi:hypothetical protein